MKIGVFGDSYAEHTAMPDAWWRRLGSDHGHQVKSFGSGGSSIVYSINLLTKHHREYDFNIWCLTTPGRFSIDSDGLGNFFHSTASMNTQGMPTNADLNPRYRDLIITCQNYLKYIFDWDYENLVGKLLVDHFLNQIPNLMIIPCFSVPLKTDFHLYEVCSKEIKSIFPDKEVHEIYRYYKDIRTCHFSKTNNKILSDLVQKNLVPGIFQTDYSNFCFENIDLEEILSPI